MRAPGVVSGSKSSTEAGGTPPGRIIGLSAIGIGLAVIVLYLPVRDFDFLEFDDPAYVFKNPDLRNGLTAEAAKAVFTKAYVASWHPVAMLSHAIDISLFGLDAGMHHIMNVLFHVVNSVLVLFVWYRLTGRPAESALLAAVWAIHPQHIEPVAWISSRKDLVSTLFMLLALVGYWRFVRSGRYEWYLVALILVGFGLLAKPMLVTVPFLLILIDYWPLKRIRDRSSAIRCVLEKVPFLAMCLAVGLVTQWVQSSEGAVRSLEEIPLRARLLNVPMAYTHYIIKTFWPTSLSIYYPHSVGDVPPAKVVVATVLVFGLTLFTFSQWRRRPYLFVGWLWFVVALIPVIGLVQFGTHGMADRYTYVPHLGLLTAVVWTGAEICRRRRLDSKLILAVVVAALAALGATSSNYLKHFRNDITLFTYVEQTVGPSLVQLVNLANGLMSRGAFAEALVALEKSFEIEPKFLNPYNNAGVCYLALDRYDLALQMFQRGRERADGGEERAMHNMDIAQAKIDAVTIELWIYQQQLEQSPSDPELLLAAADRLYKLGRLDKAERVYKKVSTAKPTDPRPARRLGDIYMQTARKQHAVVEYARALNSGGPPQELLYLIARTLHELGRADEARQYLSRALESAEASVDSIALSMRI